MWRRDPTITSPNKRNRSRGAAAPEGCCRFLTLKQRGRAGRRGPAGPAALCGNDQNHTGMVTTAGKAGLPGVPRAVFFGLLRMAPGGLTFQAPPPFPTVRGLAPIHRWWDKLLRRGVAPLA